MINLTIVGRNEKSIEIINTISNQQVLKITDNETVNLSYSNYILDIKTTSSDFVFSNLWSNTDLMTGDIIFVFLSLLIIVAFFTVPKIIKELTK